MNINYFVKASPVILLVGTICGIFFISEGRKTIAEALTTTSLIHETQDRDISRVTNDISTVMSLPVMPVHLPSFRSSLPEMKHQFSSLSKYYGIKYTMVIGNNSSGEDSSFLQHVVKSDARFPGVLSIPFSFSAHAESLVSFSLMWRDISSILPISLDDVELKVSEDGIVVEGKAILFGGKNEV